MPEISEQDFAVDQREQALLAWLRIQYTSGMALLKKEKAWEQTAQAIAYIDGKHNPAKGKAMSKITDNRLRKLALEVAATMTDVRPIWNYETIQEQLKKQADVLNKLARAWWRSNRIDRRLVTILLYSLVGGSGYGLLTFNAELADGKGDMELIPFDPRDVIPVEPTYSDNIQEWRGIILRQRLPLDTVKRMFPTKAPKLAGKETTWSPAQQSDKIQSAIISPQWDVLEGKRGTVEPNGVDVMRAYLKDDSLNLTDKVITMGQGDWAYDVYPIAAVKPDGTLATKQDARLYPRGRFIAFTPEVVLKDIPNPHWHGKFPVIRFTLDPLPWSLLGASVIGDLIPLQDSLNEALRGSDDGLAQWVRRSVQADKRAMPKSALDSLDMRASGVKISYNPAMGEPFKVLDGPAPQVFEIYDKLIAFLKAEIEDTGGIAGITNLAQMGQMPSADTLERYMEALSPILRLRARNMEISLSELADMLKVGFFQWYNAPRRIELLGKDGLTREDFDFDPGTMIPEGDGSRMERAMKHHMLFSFQVAPGSWLNVSHTQQKMFYLQLFRDQMLDPWTIWDQFDVPDAGPMPAETVPERIVAARKTGLMQGPTPEIVQTQLALQMAQLQAQLLQIQQQMQMMAAPPGAAPPGPGGPTGPGGPEGGGGEAPPEEGPQGNVGPKAKGGRPPSAQQPPHFETRDQGTRPIIAES